EVATLRAKLRLDLLERRGRLIYRGREIAFSSERKRTSTTEIDHEHGDARVLIAKGAPGVLLERCTRARIGMEVVALDEDMRARILGDVAAMAADALRTLGVAYRPLAAGEEDGSDGALERGV